MNANELADEIQERMNGLNTNDDVRVFDYAYAKLDRLHEMNQHLRSALLAIREYKFMPSVDNQIDAENKFREALRILGESNEA
jgi:hypothetical protein